MFLVKELGPSTDDSELYEITLEHGPLKARIVSFGASLAGLWHAAAPHSLTLALPKGRDYQQSPNYLGAVIGRVANRIGDGRARIAGKTHRLSRNDNGCHTLHGGAVGLSHCNWALKSATADQVVLTRTLPDGDMGFPGRLKITATYRLSDDALSLDLAARSSAPTLCSLSHHGYFNLDGGKDLRHHRLKIAAESYLKTDKDKIPTGKLRAVVGSKRDYRDPAPISPKLDHNFCIGHQPNTTLRPVAWLQSKRSDLALELSSTAPGLQAYAGAHLEAPFRTYQGLALEPQGWPDACHHDHFPSTELLPEEEYLHQIRWKLSAAQS